MDKMSRKVEKEGKIIQPLKEEKEFHHTVKDRELKERKESERVYEKET